MTARPGLAMAAVICGGCVNVFGDWFLVFPMNMGLSGAALATLIGNGVQALIMLSYFFRPSCQLRLVLPSNLLKAFRKILSVGIGASVIDFATVFLIILINNQIMRYGNATDLAVYGVAATIAALFQAMFCGVGQAIQPIVSANFGAGQHGRCREVWQMSFATALLLGVIFVLTCMLFPTQIVPDLYGRQFGCAGSRAKDPAALLPSVYFPGHYRPVHLLSSEHYAEPAVHDRSSLKKRCLKRRLAVSAPLAVWHNRSLGCPADF